MKRFLFVVTIALFAASAQASDVNVSVSVGQPGFYGRIDIGSAPPPEVIYTKPVTVRPPHGHPPPQQPLYLRVPPGHQKKWSKHCAQYNACGQPVYFVKDKWYNDVYVPHYRDGHRNDRRHDDRRDYDRDRGKGRDRDDRGRGQGRDDRDDRGRGQGRN